PLVDRGSRTSRFALLDRYKASLLGSARPLWRISTALAVIGTFAPLELPGCVRLCRTECSAPKGAPAGLAPPEEGGGHRPPRADRGLFEFLHGTHGLTVPFS